MRPSFGTGSVRQRYTESTEAMSTRGEERKGKGSDTNRSWWLREERRPASARCRSRTCAKYAQTPDFACRVIERSLRTRPLSSLPLPPFLSLRPRECPARQSPLLPAVFLTASRTSDCSKYPHCHLIRHSNTSPHLQSPPNKSKVRNRYTSGRIGEQTECSY